MAQEYLLLPASCHFSACLHKVLSESDLLLLEKYTCLGFSPRDSYLTGPGWNWASVVFKRPPGDYNMQLELRISFKWSSLPLVTKLQSRLDVL